MQIPKRMRAAVFYGQGDIKVEQVDVPKIKPDEVLIKVRYCGICGTDAHIYRGIFSVSNPPRILGHEFSGEVVQIGDDVTFVKVGDRVTADINVSCGHCYYCRFQQKLLCRELRQISLQEDGAFAEYVKVPAANVYRIPEGLSCKHAAYVEPLACAIHGQEILGIRMGCSAAIIGAGPMGLTHLVLARLRGAAPIIITEINRERLEKAKVLGADYVLDASQVDVTEEIKKITKGIGADYVIEAVGSTETYQQGFEIVRDGGNLTAYGAAPQDATINIRPFDIYRKEAVIKGSYAGTYSTWRQAIALLAYGRFNPDGIISRVIPLDQVVEGIKHIVGHENVIKILVSLGL